MLTVVIDELTNSVIEVATGKSFSTSVKPTTIEELQTLEIDWQFDWIAEFDRGEVFKLIVSKLGRQIHGLISLISTRRSYLDQCRRKSSGKHRPPKKVRWCGCEFDSLCVQVGV